MGKDEGWAVVFFGGSRMQRKGGFEGEVMRAAGTAIMKVSRDNPFRCRRLRLRCTQWWKATAETKKLLLGTMMKEPIQVEVLKSALVCVGTGKSRNTAGLDVWSVILAETRIHRE